MTRIQLLGLFVVLPVLACSGTGRTSEDTPSVICGEGTQEVSGECLPTTPATAGLTCGRDTVEVDGACLGTVVCGDGTMLDGTVCQVAPVACGDHTIFEEGRCVGTGGTTVSCGSNTRLSGGQCLVASGACASGTSLQSGQCVVSAAACGANASLQGGQCVGAGGGATVACGANTQLQSGSCVVAASACATGTTLQSGKCVPTSTAPTITCGTGTVLSGSQCLPAPASTSSIAQFIDSTSNYVAAPFRNTTLSSGWDVWADLTISSASRTQTDAFIQAGAGIVGSASMFIIRSDPEQIRISNSTPSTTVRKDISPRTSCSGTAFDDRPPYQSYDTYVTYGTWSGGTASGNCAKAGSITYTWTKATKTLEIILNIEFSSGATIVDKVITYPLDM